jgi:hypothetical protein
MMALALNQEEVGETAVATRSMADRTLLEDILAVVVETTTTRIRATTAKDPRTMVTEIIIVAGMMVVKAKIGDLVVATKDMEVTSMAIKSLSSEVTMMTTSPELPKAIRTTSNPLPAPTKDLRLLLLRTMRTLSMSATSASTLEMKT